MTQHASLSPLINQVVAALSRRDTNKARSILAQASNSGAATKDSAFCLASEGLIGLSQSQMDGLRARTSSLILLAEGCVVARMNNDAETLGQIEKLMISWPPLGFSAYPVVFGEVAQRALSMQQQALKDLANTGAVQTELAKRKLLIKNCTAAVEIYLYAQQPEPACEALSETPRG